MELIRGIHNIKPHHHGCVLTMGNFDGVHRGHVHVLKHLSLKAKAYGVPSMAMTFEPQPQEFFAPDTSPGRLCLLRDKLSLMQPLDIDYLLCVYFKRSLANATEEAFVKDLLVDTLGVRYIVIGDDFKYGKARQGDFSTLKAAGLRYGFEVESTSSFMYEGQRVSSSLIRNSLKRGDLMQARHLLGHSFSLRGRVHHGQKIGRTLGFPTANIALKRKQVPVSGVFAARLRYDATWMQGVANIGFRPTMDGKVCLLEVHLFDFDDDLYGQAVEVELVSKLRDEKPFASIAELKHQITHDAQQAYALFQRDDDVQSIF